MTEPSNLPRRMLVSSRAGVQTQIQSPLAITHAAKACQILLEVILFLLIAFCLIMKKNSKRENVVSFFH